MIKDRVLKEYPKAKCFQTTKGYTVILFDKNNDSLDSRNTKFRAPTAWQAWERASIYLGK